MILALIKEYGLEDLVLYSSFSNESVALLQKLDPTLDLGVLDPYVEKSMAFADSIGIKSIHPFIKTVTPEQHLKGKGYTVRVWNIYKFEPFFQEEGEPERYDLDALEELGITDVFTNNADWYVPKRNS